jgi:hypothetical protein
MSHTCHVRYVYAWRYDGRHVHILIIVILEGGSCRITAATLYWLLAGCLLLRGSLDSAWRSKRAPGTWNYQYTLQLIAAPRAAGPEPPQAARHTYYSTPDHRGERRSIIATVQNYTICVITVSEKQSGKLALLLPTSAPVISHCGRPSLLVSSVGRSRWSTRLVVPLLKSSSTS